MPASNNTSTLGRSSRSGPSKAIVVLRLPSNLLAQFAGEVKEELGASPAKVKEPSSPASSATDPVLPASSVDNASDAASTPAAGTAAAEALRRKGMPGPKPGTKRALAQNGDSASKPRGKPGPKKKPRLEDGTIDHTKLTAAGHKLGPKANTGAINAGLRALDRTGAPCRKWERKPLQLKSFTGILWQLPTWRSPKPPKTEDSGDAKETSALETGDSDSKANHSASGVPSEKSNLGDGDLTPLPPTMVDSAAAPIAMTA